MKSRALNIFTAMVISVIIGISFFPPKGAAIDDIKLSYRFEEPEISRAGEYDRIEIAGLKQYMEIGKPVLPFKTARILLPHGTNYSDVKVYPSEMIDIKGKYLIEPGQSPYIEEDRKEINPDPDIYSSSTLYPPDIFKTVTIQTKRGYRILFVNIFPVRYFPAEGKLSWCREIEIQVSTQPVEKIRSHRGLKKDRALIMRRVDNPEIAETYPLKSEQGEGEKTLGGGRLEPSWPPQTEATAIEYVIITNNELKTAQVAFNFQSLETHREQNSLNTAIVTTEQITNWYSGTRPDDGVDDQTKIRNFIIDVAGNEDGSGKWQTDYILLGGNCDIVPARKFFLNGQTDHSSDLYYCCLDGTFDYNANGTYGEQTDGEGGGEVDLLAEVAIGRFSVGTSPELSNIVRKSISYEDSTDKYLHKAFFSALAGESHFDDWMETLKWGTNSTNGFNKEPFFSEWGTYYDGKKNYGFRMVEEINKNNTHIFNNCCHGWRASGMDIRIEAYGSPVLADLGDINNTIPFFALINDCNAGEFGVTPHTPSNHCFCGEVTYIEHGAFATVGCSFYGPAFYKDFWDGVLTKGYYRLGMASEYSKEENIGGFENTRGTYYGQNLFGDPVIKLKFNRVPLILGNGDFNGDGTSDVSIFRSNSGLWSIMNITRVYFGTKTDLPINGDYDGDGTTDIAIFRKTSGLWAIRNLTRYYYGNSKDMPIPSDYDGDGTINIAIYRPYEAKWFIKDIGSYYFGDHMDIPTILDHNGDGSDEIAIFRPSSGLWAVKDRTRCYFGSEEDLPIPGDYDGDGADEITIFRPSSNLWAIRNVTRYYFGDFDSYYGIPVPADYDGNNKEDIGIFRPTNGLWAARNITRCYYGSYIDFPLAEAQ